MNQHSSSKKAIMSHIFLTITVLVWSVEFVFVKTLRLAFDSWTIVFFKYFLGLLLVIFVKLIMDRTFKVTKKDLGMLALSAFLGIDLYYMCQYAALDYLPISIITIFISMTPLFSIVLDRIFFKKPIAPAIILLLFVSLFGIMLVIGADFRDFLNGQFIGYLLTLTAIGGWLCWLYIPGDVQKRQSSISIVFWQFLSAVIVLAPYALSHLPAASEVTPSMIGMLLYIGLVIAGMGCLLYVYSLTVLGPTITSLYCNFIPPCSALYSWLLLGEVMLPLQMFGGLLIIGCGFVIIKLRSKSVR